MTTSRKRGAGRRRSLIGATAMTVLLASIAGSSTGSLVSASVTDVAATGPAHGPRHLAPRTWGKTVSALVFAVVLVTGGASTLAQAAFNDTGRVRTTVVAHKVPTAIPETVGVDGTGQIIKTRIKVSCAGPAEMAWRWHDQMVGWGDFWNPWSAWSTTTSSAGWTGWSTSRMDYAGQPAQVQWEVRCGISTWTSTAVLSPASQIIRTS